jgi:hypothetical protein
MLRIEPTRFDHENVNAGKNLPQSAPVNPSSPAREEIRERLI